MMGFEDLTDDEVTKRLTEARKKFWNVMAIYGAHSDATTRLQQIIDCLEFEQNARVQQQLINKTIRDSNKVNKPVDQPGEKKKVNTGGESLLQKAKSDAPTRGTD